MDRPRCSHETTALLLALVTISAGCGGMPNLGGSTDSTPIPTSTPTPEPLAPGITDNEVIDAGQLLQAHRRMLDGRSYTIRSVLAVTDSTGSLIARQIVVVKVGADGQFTLDQRVEGRFPWENTTIPGPDVYPGDELVHPQSEQYIAAGRRRAWSNGSVTYVAKGRDPDYQRYEAGDAPIRTTFLDGGGDIHSYLTNTGPIHVSTTQINGWQVYRIESTFDKTAMTTASRQDGAVTVVAAVDSFGLVHRLRATYDLPDQFGEGHVTDWFRIKGIGETTIQRPAWVDDAENATDSTK